MAGVSGRDPGTKAVAPGSRPEAPATRPLTVVDVDSAALTIRQQTPDEEEVDRFVVTK